MNDIDSKQCKRKTIQADITSSRKMSEIAETQWCHFTFIYHFFSMRELIVFLGKARFVDLS